WREKIVGVKEMDNVPIIIIGNKCDLTQSRQVQSKEGQALAQKWGEYCAFFETSAKDKIYIEEVFFEVVRKIRLIEEETGGTKQKQVKTSQSDGQVKNETAGNTDGSTVPLSSTPIVWNFQVLGEEIVKRTPTVTQPIDTLSCGSPQQQQQQHQFERSEVEEANSNRSDTNANHSIQLAVPVGIRSNVTDGSIVTSCVTVVEQPHSGAAKKNPQLMSETSGATKSGVP
ncbi:hypothetical protein RFI_21643, partial [Reticulomyxa filosa]